MSAKAKRLETDASSTTIQSASRQPQQGRSKASLERMLSAASELMLERGNEDFTLQEVSQRGNVSIGSIYLRFDGKDNLVRAVIFQSFETLEIDEQQMMDAIHSKSKLLADFIANYVEAYAELLRGHSPILRLAMDRAAYDPLVSAPGKDKALSAEESGTAAMLRYADEIGGDAAMKASSAYHVIFATLARELSLGSTGESANNYDWELLKRELGRMCLAYLRAE